MARQLFGDGLADPRAARDQCDLVFLSSMRLRIRHSIPSDFGHLIEGMRPDVRGIENILDDNAASGESVGDRRTMASPGNGLGAHDGRRPLRAESDEHAQPVVELRRLHAIGEAAKRRVPPTSIDR